MSTTTRYRRVIDGEVFDTATATVLAQKYFGDDNEDLGPGFEHCNQVCLNRNGSWFLMVRNEPYWNKTLSEPGPDYRDRMELLTNDEAAELLMAFKPGVTA